MSKSLFTEDEAWTQEANDLALKISGLLKPIFQEFSEMEYPLREVTTVIYNETLKLEIVTRAMAGIKKRKEKKTIP